MVLCLILTKIFIININQVDNFNDLFAFKPEGSFILTFRNEDRPGAISEVSPAAELRCLSYSA